LARSRGTVGYLVLWLFLSEPGFIGFLGFLGFLGFFLFGSVDILSAFQAVVSLELPLNSKPYSGIHPPEHGQDARAPRDWMPV
jgi:hypothetical protein